MAIISSKSSNHGDVGISPEASRNMRILCSMHSLVAYDEELEDSRTYQVRELRFFSSVATFLPFTHRASAIINSFAETYEARAIVSEYLDTPNEETQRIKDMSYKISRGALHVFWAGLMHEYRIACQGSEYSADFIAEFIDRSYSAVILGYCYVTMMSKSDPGFDLSKDKEYYLDLLMKGDLDGIIYFFYLCDTTIPLQDSVKKYHSELISAMKSVPVDKVKQIQKDAYAKAERLKQEVTEEYADLKTPEGNRSDKSGHAVPERDSGDGKGKASRLLEKLRAGNKSDADSGEPSAKPVAKRGVRKVYGAPRGSDGSF